MIRRLALFLFLMGAPFLLSGCAAANLARAPFTMLNGMFGAAGRVIGRGADGSSTRQPLRLETGEIERARTGEQVPQLPVMPEKAGQVAVQ